MQDKKKILLLRSTPYDPNLKGYNIQEIGIGRAFCRLGYDYDHICFKKKGQTNWTFYESNGCKARFIEYPRWRFMRWGLNFDLCKKDFLDQYDIIICREYYQLMTFLISRKGTNVVMYNGPYYNMFKLKFFSPIYDCLFTKAIDKNINVKFVKSVLSEDFLINKGYHHVVNVGVGLDIERFEKETEIAPETQSIIDYMTENRCLLYVGSISERKNYPFLLKVYEKVLEKEPDVKFVVIGTSKIGAFSKLIGIPDIQYERDVIKRFPDKVKKGIYRVQRIDNSQLKYIYPLAKAFLLPSIHEIFGMVLLEAMYLGAPIVSSRNGGSMTLIKNEAFGAVINSFDVEKWATATLRYLNDIEYRHRVVENGKRLIREDFTWDSIAIKMLKELDTIK